MSEQNMTLAEAAQLCGVNVEDLHGRVWRGELPGVASPTNRSMGTIPESVVQALVAARRQEHQVAEAPLRRDFYSSVPVEAVAGSLGLTVAEVERLLIHGELEGTYLHPRWVSVKSASLACFRARMKVLA